jgi:hypothetical protein
VARGGARLLPTRKPRIAHGRNPHPMRSGWIDGGAGCGPPPMGTPRDFPIVRGRLDACAVRDGLVFCFCFFLPHPDRLVPSDRSWVGGMGRMLDRPRGSVSYRTRMDGPTPSPRTNECAFRSGMQCDSCRGVDGLGAGALFFNFVLSSSSRASISSFTLERALPRDVLLDLVRSGMGWDGRSSPKDSYRPRVEGGRSVSDAKRYLPLLPIPFLSTAYPSSLLPTSLLDFPLVFPLERTNEC